MLEKQFFYNDYRLVESESCCDKIRVRKHKRKRIDKKFLKRYGYKLVPSNSIYIIDEMKMIIGYPTVMRKIIDEINGEE